MKPEPRRSWEIVNASQLCFCGDEATHFVTIKWPMGEGMRDHPVCRLHLQAYRLEFDRFALELKRRGRKAGDDDSGIIAR